MKSRLATFPRFILSAMTLGFCSGAGPLHSAPDGISTVRERMAEHYASTGEASGLPTEKLLASLSPDGKWPDLEAAFNDEQAGYARYGHFRRILQLAGAWRTEKDPARKAMLAEAIHRALAVWLGREAPGYPNWQKQIGSPKVLARAAVLFAEALSDNERQQATAILQTCVRSDGTLDYAGAPATGANLLDEVETQIAAGCLLHDAAMVSRYVRMAEREMEPGHAEGLQVDMSFFQHGPQLYSGGYGAGFAQDAAGLAGMLRETEFAFSTPTVESLLRFVLDGGQKMTRGGSLDFTTVGRQISRENMDGPAAQLLDALDSLAPLAGARTDELRRFAERLRGTAPARTAPAGTSVFWKADYITHSRPGFFASARMSSRRVEGTECGNGENEMGYHLGDGAMTLMVTGEEYRNIFPLWDWTRIPGVSCVVNPQAPLPRHIWGRGAEGFSDFAGGVTDGGAGAAAMELHRGGLHARKAWFFLHDAVVCLGADILPDDPALPVVTSIDQRWARGPVTSSFADEPLATGTLHAFADAGWVHHDGVSYLFPTGGKVRLRTDHKTAGWSAINQSVNQRAISDPAAGEKVVAGDVFSLWIDHGASLFTPTTYAYVVAPGLQPADIPAFQKTTPAILANTAALQAIAGDDLVQAVVWQPGELRLPDDRVLTVDRPCLLQLRRESRDKPWIMAVGNPTQTPGPVHVGITMARSKASPALISFDFPAGPYVGQPQVKILP